MILSKDPADNGSFQVKQKSECLQSNSASGGTGKLRQSLPQLTDSPAHSGLFIARFHSLQQHIFNYWEKILSLTVVEKK